MATTLTIKKVPNKLADALKRRAAAHHRSMQGELLSILEDAVAPRRFLTVDEVAERIKRLGFSTPDESVEMIRADRDAR